MKRYAADHLLTMDGDLGRASPGIVDVAEGTVVWAGDAADASPAPDAELVEVPGMLMPGMVDAHCHTPMVLLRGAGEGLPVDRWLHEVIWPREGRLTKEDVEWGMVLGAAELLRSGVTTTNEMYFFGDAIARAAVRIGMRTIACSPIIDDPNLVRFGTWQEQLDGIAALSAAWHGHPLVEIGIGPHAAYGLARTTLEHVAAFAADHGLLTHIHVAEQRGEAALLTESGGLSAPAYLDEVGLLAGRTLAAHCVWVDEDDISLLAEREVGVAHCPCSNAKHGSGTAPVDHMRAAGIPVAIATDGPSSHNRLDMFEEMRTAIRLARVHHLDAGRLSPAAALQMVTREAADALGRPDLGRLTPGAKADMIEIALDDTTMIPRVDESDLITHLVWSGSPAAVRRVWVGGELVATAGRPARIDLAEAAAEVGERARRIAGR